MMKIILLLALLCVGIYAQDEKDVHVLTSSNFDDFVNNEDISLVEFYAPWCGHCKKLTPEYAKAATELKDIGVKLAKVDATEQGELAQKFGVTGYPTLKVFRSGAPTDYKGPRDAAGIVSYMKKQATPSITNLKSTKDLDKFVKDEAAVIYFGDSDAPLYKTFEKFASKHREEYRFATSSDADVLESSGHKDQIVLVQSKRYSVSPLETAKVIASDEHHTSDGLLSFIKGNLLPLVGEITADNLPLYKSVGKPIVKIYQDIDWQLNSKGANYLMNRVRKLAKDYKDKFTFAIASTKGHQSEINDAGLKGSSPFAIHNEKGHKYPGSSAFSVESLKQHLEDFLAEKLEPYLKSEAVPSSQDSDKATVVVGKTFDQIVNDPTKDVLIEAYAPWCGHCKTLAPKYDELASKMKEYDSVVIAKIDATANDIPSNFAVKGYPSIFFVPANNKASPMSYDGSREVDGFVSYIKKHASIPLKKSVKADGKDEL
eukprot:TRINITY_DN680_c0_g1_i2.p1 TRINITY_DN680_c0_g1~~TRINITY_DN680_c0_g1_i2.p1  ORF type:complete len:486 (-),score=145.18 TRINITY_DN680_c0_g1_i2:40-1497(-)